MTNSQIRAQVVSVYNNETWRQKVQKMDDFQVLAIYKNLQKRKKLK